ncbi:MAG: hypothetical protein EAX91_12835 [Candidatus Lokiarchaeota archaeon]|nr:hypothetical protein [Candidatus Lokiarchaeota archaeon]
MGLDINIYNFFDIIKESYRFIDFRSILYRKNKVWIRFLTILRFSNESEEEIKKRYEILKLRRYKTDNLIIDYQILEVSEWEDKIISIYDELNEEFEIYDYNDFRYDYNKYNKFLEDMFSDVKISLNTPNRRFFLTENELSENNLITFNLGFNTNEKHLNFSNVANREILLLGDNNIYDVINRTFQLEGYDSNNNLNILINFPIYFRFVNLQFSQQQLSGKIIYHKIYKGSKIFFRIYSEPSFREEFFVGDKNFIIGEDSEENVEKNNGLIECSFNISFKEFDCDPNFKIRVYWNKIKTNILDYQNSFDTPRYNKLFEEMNSEIKSEEKKLTIDDTIQFNENFIDIDFSDYDLTYYKSYIELINGIAIHPDFYMILPLLLRTLFENLLKDIFAQSLHNSSSDLYYRGGNRHHDFSKLIALLDLLKDNEYGPYISGKITKEVINELEDIREMGNITVHDIIRKTPSTYTKEKKDKTIITLKPLLVAYKNLNGKNILVKNERKYQIKLKLGLIKKEDKKDQTKSKKKKKSIKNNQITDTSKISSLMSEIRALITSDSIDSLNIRNKMDELLLNLKPLLNNRQRDALGKIYIIFNQFVESGFKDSAQILFDAINKIILG